MVKKKQGRGKRNENGIRTRHQESKVLNDALTHMYTNGNQRNEGALKKTKREGEKGECIPPPMKANQQQPCVSGNGNGGERLFTWIWVQLGNACTICGCNQRRKVQPW